LHDLKQQGPPFTDTLDVVTSEISDMLNDFIEEEMTKIQLSESSDGLHQKLILLRESFKEVSTA
jgi:hypothetical protein